MALSSLFVYHSAHKKGTNFGVSGEGDHVAVFLTPQSLASFPFAVAAIKVIVALVEKVSPATNQTVAAIVVAAVVGVLIFLISVAEVAARPKEPINWVIAFGIAVINTAFLAAAAIGIDVARLLGP